MFNQHLKNQKGMIMSLVMIVFMILILLGVTVLHISGADHRHSLYQDHKMQAHYLAKSGAQTMAAFLIEKAYHEDFNNMNQLINDISNKTSNVTDFENGSFIIEIVRRTVDGQEKLDIISKGNYQGISETVTATLLLSIETGGEDYNPSSDENALVALCKDGSNALDLSGGAFLEGNIVVNTTQENSIRFRGGGDYNIRNGSLYLPHGSDPHYIIDTDKGARNEDAPEEYRIPEAPSGQYFNNWAFWRNIEDGVKFTSMPSYPSSKYPEPIFPEYPSISKLPEPDNLNFTTPIEGEYYLINEDGYYNLIHPSGSRTITIDLAGGDRIIRVGDLNLTGGYIELINAGEDSRLLLYVDNTFSIGSNRSLNGNGIPDNVHIYYAGTQTVQIDGASRFSGNIFVREADIVFTAGANMKGNIISLGTHVNVTGGSSANDMILYAPNALVEMGGSAQIKGSVIANTFKRSGGGNAGVIYSPNASSVPGDFFGGANNIITIEYDENPWR